VANFHILMCASQLIPKKTPGQSRMIREKPRKGCPDESHSRQGPEGNPDKANLDTPTKELS